MTKQVLDVGNCSFDHASLRGLIESNFDATVSQAHGEEDALTALRVGTCDLVLVNRILDRDHSEGIELIRKIKADERTARVPIMMITNYHEQQQAAMEAGAEHGFGKQAVSDPDTLSKLAGILGERGSNSSLAGDGN